MNTLTTESFVAERQPNGDVFIRSGKYYWKQAQIRIPKEQCEQLARLLRFDLAKLNTESDEEEWMPDYNPSQAKVDYNHHPWEPE